MHAKTVKKCKFARNCAINKLFHIGDISGDLSADIGRLIGRYFKYRPFFTADDMANDFSLSYRQQAKNEISDDISADSADI